LHQTAGTPSAAEPTPPGSLLDVSIRRTRAGRTSPSEPVAASAPPPQPEQPLQDRRPQRGPRPGTEPCQTPPRGDEDLLEYWRRLKDRRPYPTWSDFNRDQISRRWPDSVLLNCVDAGTTPKLEATFSALQQAAMEQGTAEEVTSIEYESRFFAKRLLHTVGLDGGSTASIAHIRAKCPL